MFTVELHDTVKQPVCQEFADRKAALECAFAHHATGQVAVVNNDDDSRPAYLRDRITLARTHTGASIYLASGGWHEGTSVEDAETLRAWSERVGFAQGALPPEVE